MKAVWLSSIGIIAAGLVFLLIWMNRFQYEHSWATQTLVRINRFTGQQCILTVERGWVSRVQSDEKWKQYESGTAPDKDSLSAALLFSSSDTACQ